MRSLWTPDADMQKQYNIMNIGAGSTMAGADDLWSRGYMVAGANLPVFICVDILGNISHSDHPALMGTWWMPVDCASNSMYVEWSILPRE